MKLSAFWGGARFSQFWLIMAPAGFLMKNEHVLGALSYLPVLANYDSGRFFDEVERFLGAVSSLVSFD